MGARMSHGCFNRAPYAPSVPAQDGLTQDRLKELFEYDPETGLFTKKPRKGSRGRWTMPVVYGVDGANEYVQIRVDGRNYGAHRLAFLYMDGVLPTSLVDHRDGSGRNNRWSNLRQATYQQNTQANHRQNKNNTSGYRGVYWAKGKNKWQARIEADGKEIHLGYFECPAAASEAYRAKKAEVHFS
jgi:hypothetical protein